MTFYRFQSEWVVESPIDAVFELLVSPDTYSDWWPAVKDSRLVSRGDDNGIGARAIYSIGSPLLYTLHFEAVIAEIVRPTLIHMKARGDLEGTGVFELSESGATTSARYLWSVSTTKAWMNAVAPLARPVFVWAHHRVMRQGGAGLARRLGSRVVSTSSKLLSGSGFSRRGLPDG